jgi:hypothetical protein
VAPFAPVALALAMKVGQPAQKTPPEPSANLATWTQKCPNPHYPTMVSTAIDDAPCGISGSGGKETFQNDAKNNFCAPDPPTPTTIAELIALQQKAQGENIPFGQAGPQTKHPLSAESGPDQDRAAVEALGEGQQIVLQGFVNIARQEGGESVNCGKNVPNKPEFHDIHISIVQNQTDTECDGVVVEMTPHHRPAAWTATLLNQVAGKKLLVQVTGQRFFDSSHSPCQKGGVHVNGDPLRASLWEIHPIYKFEVCPSGNCASGGWIPLEFWKP